MTDSCISCGSDLPLREGRRRHRETHHDAYCQDCLALIRLGTGCIICIVCGVSKPSAGNYPRNGGARTGYGYTCLACTRAARDAVEQPLRVEARIESLRGTDRERDEGTRLAGERRAAMRLTCPQCGEEKPAEGNFLRLAASRTGFARTCEECRRARNRATRERVAVRTCQVCRRELPAARHFEPNDFMRTGYSAVCRGCEALPEETRREIRRSRFPVKDRPRADWEDPAYWVRYLVGRHRRNPGTLRSGQRIYALADPRDDSIRYVGCSSDPAKRLREHLRSKADNNEEKMAWIAELRDASMLPRLVILEEVEDSQRAWEREDRWILYHLHGGEPLTNWQASFEHLAKAVLETELDYLSAPLSADVWGVLVGALRMDQRERLRGGA